MASDFSLIGDQFESTRVIVVVCGWIFTLRILVDRSASNSSGIPEALLALH